MKIIRLNIGSELLDYTHTMVGYEKCLLGQNESINPRFIPERGVFIPIVTHDKCLTFQLIPKSVLIEILKAYLPEINSNLTNSVIGKKAKVVLKRKRKTHK